MCDTYLTLYCGRRVILTFRMDGFNTVHVSSIALVTGLAENVD
jgi:hypothetical protein